MDEPTHGELLTQAIAGDQASWDALVERFEALVWSLARSFRLDHATAMDVAQTVWLKLVENAERIHDPERLPGWLATTTRREALRVIEIRSRQIPSEFDLEPASDDPALEAMAVEDEQVRAILAAQEALDGKCQQLFRLLCTAPPLSYEEISQVTGMAVGSIGPTRERCLKKLRHEMNRQARAENGIDRGNP